MVNLQNQYFSIIHIKYTSENETKLYSAFKQQVTTINTKNANTHDQVDRTSKQENEQWMLSHKGLWTTIWTLKLLD